jgi:BirA family biotin operon repressor/biotin-[acetyl-CoA-carboxylase] ligase
MALRMRHPLAAGICPRTLGGQCADTAAVAIAPGYTAVFATQALHDDGIRVFAQLVRTGRRRCVVSIQPAGLLAELSAQRAISGSELARRLGVTRAAVWKQVEALRALGAPIEATAGRGYRLSWPLEPLDAVRLCAEIEPDLRRRLGEIDVRWQVDSTNATLLRRAAEGACDLSICVAETQSAGRGRRGRDWRSPLGGNVYFSLLKRFTHGMGSLSGLSLAVAVALVEALADCGVAGIGLKWPNDVLADGRKLAGILVELGGEFLGPCHAVIGIGINLRLPPDLPIEQPYAALAELCAGSSPSRHRLISRLLTHLVAALDRFAEAGFGAFQEEYAQHDLLRGRSVRVQTADAIREGIADGVDARGALRVRHGADIALYDSAEVKVRSA